MHNNVITNYYKLLQIITNYYKLITNIHRLPAPLVLKFPVASKGSALAANMMIYCTSLHVNCKLKLTKGTTAQPTLTIFFEYVTKMYAHQT